MSINFSKKTAVSTKELFRQAEFDNILKCVHCGLCLESCPTYRELEDEKDSPRGRLYLMRGLWEGELELEQSVIDPLSRCLDCRACESACPSGVPYGELLEKTRGIILENTPQSLKERFLRNLLLKGLFRYTSMMIAASRILKIYAATGLPKFITKTFIGKLFPKSFVFQQHLLPNCSGIYVLDTSSPNLKMCNNLVDIGPGPLELIEARKEIEGAIAELAAQRIDMGCLEQLEQAIDKMVHENKIGAEGDREFHLLVAKAAGNSVLETITVFLWDQQQNSPMWAKLIERMKEKKLHTAILDDHQCLLDSLRQKDSKGSKAIMRNHLNHARDIYFDLMGEEEN